MRRLKTNIPIILLIFCICVSLFIAGCSDAKPIEGDICFRYDKSFTPLETHLRGTLKSQNKTGVSLTRGMGIIDWVPNEGSFIASGALITRINMDNQEEGFRQIEYSLFNEKKNKEKINYELPQTISEKEKEILNQNLNLEFGKYEKKWLLSGKQTDERRKIQNDTKISLSELEFAESNLKFQKRITKKGFSSLFELRTKEIETKSKKIELGYINRLAGKMDSPPLEEELAKVEHQIQVASGETWLASNDLRAASISFQIRTKSNEARITRTSTRYDKIEKILKQRKIYAARSGIVIQPIMWGQKFGIGSQIWTGITFLEIVSTGSLYIEAVVDEAEISSISMGDKAKIIFDLAPDAVSQGKVTSISKSPRRIKTLRGKSKLKKFPIRVSVNIASDTIVLGAKATLVIQQKQQKGIFVPRDAILIEKKECFVKIKTSFGFKKIKAEILNFNTNWVLWKNAPADKGILLY